MKHTFLISKWLLLINFLSALLLFFMFQSLMFVGGAAIYPFLARGSIALCIILLFSVPLFTLLGVICSVRYAIKEKYPPAYLVSLLHIAVFLMGWYVVSTVMGAA